MKYLLFLFFASLLLLGETVLALDKAMPAETLYFYNAYLVEFNTKEYSERNIAKLCAGKDATTPCSYKDFLNFIRLVQSTDYTNPLDKPAIKKIIEGDITDIAKTSQSLREKKFGFKYDLSKLIEGTKKKSAFGDVFEKIEGMIKDSISSDKVTKDDKSRIKTALEIVRDHRIADNMTKYFIPQLNKELGITLETRGAETADGMAYNAYDTDKTKKKLQDDGKTDEANELSGKVQKVVLKMRSPDYKIDDGSFKGHQAVIAQVKKSMKTYKC